MRSFGLFCAIFLSGAIAAAAQDQTASPPAHVSMVEGSATIDHDGESEPVVLNMPVLEGDRIRTGSGRVEVLFADGSSISIDPDSDVEFLGDTRVRVSAGAIEHRAAAAVSSSSSPYLPADLQPYSADFDRYGSWQDDASYGSVWYPTVAADWRPYYYGYWAPMRTYGWTWIGYDRWTWPTHHYGRWGYSRNRWFWIPGRTWGAAWVSWGTAPDYVSWCPLGYDGRPVVALSVGYRSSWNAWTVVPRDRFGVRGYSAHRYSIEPYRLASTTPFVIHRSAPALDRRTAPYGASRSGGIAVPRADRSFGDDSRPSTGYRPADRNGARGDRRWPGRTGEGATVVGRPPNGDTRVNVPAAPPTAVYRTPGNVDRGGEDRLPRPGYRARAGSDQRPGANDRRGGPNDQRPTYGRPAPVDQGRPTDDRRPTTIDPRRPTNERRPSTSYAVPRAEPRTEPQRLGMSPGVGSWRQANPPPQRQVVPAPQRQVAPAPQHQPSGPRAGASRPSAAPAGGPPANRGGGSRSEGTARRR
jgi:hypothetical protein